MPFGDKTDEKKSLKAENQGDYFSLF